MATLYSIIVTCHNQLDFIGDAVRSALSQTYTNREVIVVNDASTDCPLELLGAFGDEIKLVNLERNVGPPEARNVGAAVATGDCLVFLDGDDLLKPWALAIYDQILRTYNPRLILANLSWFRGEPPIPPQPDVPPEIRVVRYENMMEKDRSYRPCGSAVVIDRKTFASVGGFTSDNWWMPEHDLLAKLAYGGRSVQILEPCTVFYRIHASNAIHSAPKIIEGCNQLVSAVRRRMAAEDLGSRLRCYPLIGGPVLYGAKRAYRAGLYGEGVKLLARSWPYVIVTVLTRLWASFLGLRPIETLVVETPESTVSLRNAS